MTMQTFTPSARRWIGLALLAAGFVSTPLLGATPAPASTSVGLPARMEELVLPGSELIARPIEGRQTPLIVRIVSVAPHGTAFRYALEYYALEPGKYDLRSGLLRKDGSTVDDLPVIAVEVVSLLPAGQIVPNELASRRPPSLGGYRMLLALGTGAWVLGLLGLLLFRRQRQARQAAAQARPLTLVERLNPLVTAAVDGKLSGEQHAELERLLLTYWRRRLSLDNLEPAQALASLRQHAEAGDLLRHVEIWLHAPEGTNSADVATLLRPYRDLPEGTAAGAAHDVGPAKVAATTGGGHE